ncbi:hypothetical protein BJ138DRAFT_1139997 [Hygrophoropsis aurantiaca]|uniref:Uncharacterized protein n=1 Tax=Hygrophoropsis aurantiaca TaxID=72124 RepID=A0ACB8ASF5_9AGAM|nr:hypothetical protein BJ138DRAFT_1139997 [Hygrophoropsis aurantiaca]
MRRFFLYTICVVYLFFNLALTVRARGIATDDVDDDDTVTVPSIFTSSPPSHTSRHTEHRPHITFSTPTHTFPFHSKNQHPSKTDHPHRSSYPSSDHYPHPHHHLHHQLEAVSVVFIVLGGIGGVTLVFFLFRCWYSYHKTPRRDRIATLLSRYNLEREMAEMEHEAPRRRWSLPLPPPPYQPPPPRYLSPETSREI